MYIHFNVSYAAKAIFVDGGMGNLVHASHMMYYGSTMASSVPRQPDIISYPPLVYPASCM